MAVEVLGGSSVKRQRTGLFSLDVALSAHGELGMPMNSPVELFGNQEVGKSTLAYYLAGTLGHEQVMILDLDGADKSYLQQAFERTGFSGTVTLIPTATKKGIRPHSEALNDLGLAIKDPKISVGILDSVSAYVPNAEADGEVGDANVGRRAKDLATFSRMVVQGLSMKSIQDIPATCIVVNHAYAVIGGRGSVTAGGDTLKYLTGIRLKIWTDELLTTSSNKTNILGYVVRGKVEKLRYGGKGREFKYVILPQLGVSRELSAMFDCFDLGLATRGRQVTIDRLGLTFGYISNLIKAAVDGEVDRFNPFFDVLTDYEGGFFKEHGYGLGEDDQIIS